MKSLYISDLDGTLLNKNIELSQHTINSLNKLIDNGLNFTVATARTAATVTKILEPLNIQIPIILMNGVIIYHLATKKYLKVHTLSNEIVSNIATVMEKYNLSPFMYEIKDNILSTYYQLLKNEAMNNFYSERVTRYNKRFTKINKLSDVSYSNIIYFALLDTKDALEPAYTELQKIDGISAAFYKDIYTTDEIWYLEVFSSSATKYNGVKFLREEYGYDYLVGFGDNLNDIPLFQGCDETCAVSNAKDELKQIANHITESNEENGVVTFIEQHFKN